MPRPTIIPGVRMTQISVTIPETDVVVWQAFARDWSDENVSRMIRRLVADESQRRKRSRARKA